MERFPPPSLTCQLERTHSTLEVAVGSLRDKGYSEVSPEQRGRAGPLRRVLA